MEDRWETEFRGRIASRGGKRVGMRGCGTRAATVADRWLLEVGSSIRQLVAGSAPNEEAMGSGDGAIGAVTTCQSRPLHPAWLEGILRREERGVMSMSLRETKAIADMAELLYDFLPGSGNPKWKGHVSFQSIAAHVGVGDFWTAGSKLPAISALLERTLEQRRDLFERLILEIVKSAIVYRQKQGRPVAADEIERLNGAILGVGFKFPELWESGFIASLRAGSHDAAKDRVAAVLADEEERAAHATKRSQELHALLQDFYGLHMAASPQAAGLAFERILNRLFALHDLAPREPFRVVGEQIDGSFELDHDVYLLEAKWEKAPVAEAPLLVFRGKIEGKSKFTRGVFVSLNGVTQPAQDAIRVGKQPTFFVIDGYDLSMILDEKIGLVDFLRQRRRLLLDEGLVVVSFPELQTGSRAVRQPDG